MTHNYLGIEILTMTAGMRSTLVDALQRLGRQSGPQPCRINHWRIRPDNMAAILESEWDLDEVTPTALARRLENLYGLQPGAVSQTVTQTQYGPVVTFKTGSTNRLRAIAFGGVDATWGESLLAVTAYLADNRAAWEPQEA
jgi:hypothetical protein